MEEDGLVPLSQKEIKFLSSQPLATRYVQKISPHRKKIVGRGVYTKENKDTDTD